VTREHSQHERGVHSRTIRMSLFPCPHDDPYYIDDAIGVFVVYVVDGMLEIQAERNSKNEATLETFPPILLPQLVRLGTEFIHIVIRHRPQLKPCWDGSAIEELEQEFQDPLLAYHTESSLQFGFEPLQICNQDRVGLEDC
jgi:hypothetical protein